MKRTRRPTERAVQSFETASEDLDELLSEFSEAETEHVKSRKTIVKGSKNDDNVSFHYSLDLLPLKPDHAVRPLWIDANDRRIILEKFSPLADQALDFLIAISEPISRPALMHEYKLTTFSLYAAISVGLESKDIVDVLERLSKTPIPESIREFILNSTSSYGKVKLVLRKNNFYVETVDSKAYRKLISDSVLQSLVVDESKFPKIESSNAQTVDLNKIDEISAVDQMARTAENLYDSVVEETKFVLYFQVRNDAVEIVKRRCAELDFPVLEEYDFRSDDRNPKLDIDLKPSAQIRPYQEKSLSKMFGDGRARSGIIVLPCGAGKTLVGITAACTIKKSLIVLCTSSVSVMQWRSQFLQWTNIKSNQISIFTSDSKSKFEGDAGIVVSTYSMIANTRNRSYGSQRMMNFLTSREWGFIILDEVHVVPAAMFRRVITTIAAHSKLGLTATLVREDNKIDDLNFLIGPKLYEANWMDLAQKGHIANVQCAEVWCPMTTEFYSEYLQEKSRKRMLLYIMNPRKFQACQFLIDYHEKRGDKIIVFSDNVYALQAYALKLNKYYIYGGTPQHERMKILENFQYNDLVNTIFLSKIGDTSIDLPEATCLIQISSHYGSRRQEAQRLGRILRAKKKNETGFNAFFYSLVSKDTQEMYYSTKRQAFLIDQGYSFKVITHLEGVEKLPNLAYATKEERLELLQEVLLQTEDAAKIDTGDIENADQNESEPNKRIKRVTGNISSLAGADDMVYIEFNKSANYQLRKEYHEHHPLFKRIYAKKRY